MQQEHLQQSRGTPKRRSNSHINEHVTFSLARVALSALNRGDPAFPTSSSTDNVLSCDRSPTRIACPITMCVQLAASAAACVHVWAASALRSIGLGGGSGFCEVSACLNVCLASASRPARCCEVIKRVIHVYIRNCALATRSVNAFRYLATVACALPRFDRHYVSVVIPKIENLTGLPCRLEASPWY